MAKKKTGQAEEKDEIPPIDNLGAHPSASLFASWLALHVQSPGENLVTEKPSSDEFPQFEYKGPAPEQPK